MRQKIIPHLWFDKEAVEAASLYTSVFRDVFGSAPGDSGVKNISTIRNTPSGMVDIVTIDLAGQEFQLISAGPYFKFNPSVSFLVACETGEQVDLLWERLSRGGRVLMELDEYPFSERYGWTEDAYGLSWQVMAMGNRRIVRRITPTLMFVNGLAGKAEEAINLYLSIFGNHSTSARNESKAGDILRYGKNEEPEAEGTVKHASFTLEGYEFAAMDSAQLHDFAFNEAISFIVRCNTQEDIDYYWEKLSSVPEAEQCGWLKDKYGLSWQIVPSEMDEMLKDKDTVKIDRVTDAFLRMKKFDIEKLRQAYRG